MPPKVTHARPRHPNRQRGALQLVQSVSPAVRQRAARFAVIFGQEAARRGLSSRAAVR